MSYEDLEAARAKRQEKEAGKADKQKRGRKRKQKAGKTHVSDASVQAVRTCAPELTGTSLPVVGTPFESDVSLLAPCPGKAPVARMW
jgi:hypothetical protein